MNVLVTGAAGFIGSVVCKRLLDRGDSVINLYYRHHYSIPDGIMHSHRLEDALCRGRLFYKI